MIDYGKKGYKIAIFAVVLALLAFSISGTPGVVDDDTAYVNKSGDTWSGNMTMDGTTITTNTVSDKDVYMYQDSSTPTIRMRSRNVSESGYFELFPTHSNFYIGGKRYNFTSREFDMSYNNITNTSQFILYQSSNFNAVNFTVNRTATALANPITEFSQSSSPIKFRVTGNDATGGYNFRVNAKADQSQDDISKAGWAMVMKPTTSACGTFGSGDSEMQIWRAIPGTSTIETMFGICGNQTVYIGSTANLTIPKLAGAGNAYACVNSNGTLYRGSPGC